MSQRFLLGWEEWLALPDLGLAAVKAKIDTGARTSALHAFAVEPFGSTDRPQVRFGVHPIPGRDDVEVWCVADAIDRREVASSNGEREMRYVISTTCSLGGRNWPIEITLANRESMAYRMLLGRQALQEDMFVDPAASFRQPKLSYKVYGPRVRAQEPEQRPLAIALMTQRPESASSRRLTRVAERRGHAVTVIDRARISLYVDAREPAIYLDGRALSGIDVVLVRGGGRASAFTLAALRQLEGQGAQALNPAAALAALNDPIGTRQALARAGVAIPSMVLSHADLIAKSKSDEHVAADSLGLLGSREMLRFVVIAGRAIGVIERQAATALEAEPDWRSVGDRIEGMDAARAAAEAAARATGLGLAAIDVSLTRQGPIVVNVSANVQLAQFDRLAGTELAEAIVVHLEQDVRGSGQRG